MLVLVSGVWLVVVLGVDRQEGGGEMTLAWIAVVADSDGEFRCLADPTLRMVGIGVLAFE